MPNTYNDQDPSRRQASQSAPRQLNGHTGMFYGQPMPQQPGQAPPAGPSQWGTGVNRPSSAVPIPGQPIHSANHPAARRGAPYRQPAPTREPVPDHSGKFSAVAPLQRNDPPEPPKPKPPKKPWKPDARLLKALKYVIPVLVLALLILVGSAVSNNVKKAREQQALIDSVTAFDQQFCYGVYVDDIHLGGMSQQDAVSAVSSKAVEALSAWNVQLTFQGQTVVLLNANVLGMSIDIADAMNAAWAQGHTGSILERRAAMDALQEVPFNAYTVDSHVDLSVLDTMLQSLSEALYIAPQNASIAMFDAERTNPFIFNEEVVGRELDMAGLKETLTGMLQTKTSGVIELQVTEAIPEITVEYLEKYVVSERATAYTDISTSSTDNRNVNIRTAFSKINGTVVKPGETFSFNDVVGDRTTANGFKEALEYVYGTEQMGIGGGVCQASTTVYQAAIYAGMTIIDRHPHSLVVNYSAFGKDATVNSTKGHRVDLKFRNDTGSPIYIKAAVQSKSGQRSRLVTRVTIYGAYKGDGVTYDFDVTEEVIPAPTEAQIVLDKEGAYVTYENEEYVYQKAKDGTKVNSYHVRYLNGVEQDRTFLGTDIYNPKPQILYVGIEPVLTQP